MEFDTEPPKEQIEAEKRKKREGGGGEGGELDIKSYCTVLLWFPNCKAYKSCSQLPSILPTSVDHKSRL